MLKTRFYSNYFTDSHYSREINMYPQSKLLAKEYVGHTLPILISLDKDLIKQRNIRKKRSL
ncbi:hypothetical protein CCY16_00464 [Wolbachia endosymbiont of Wuchereria bancrofti]|nr:hypothetical protein CCY16_00464 [Wolbachia endosymbiont of Wuchereria bancrofti]